LLAALDNALPGIGQYKNHVPVRVTNVQLLSPQFTDRFWAPQSVSSGASEEVPDVMRGIFVDDCLPLLTTTFFYLSLLTFTCLYLPLHTITYLYLPLITFTYLYLPIPTIAYLHLLLLTYFYLLLLVYNYLYLLLLILTYNY